MPADTRDAAPKFLFRRARGIAWVCDLANSTSFLNGPSSVAAFEEFAPRLHLFARKITDAAQGRFVKWTGDGFFVWFESTLHRDLDAQAKRAFTAAWQLSFLVESTNLGVDLTKKFKLRHGITLEQDALVSEFPSDAGGAWDLLGRNIVLAFRLSGIDYPNFPNIFTTREVIDLAGSISGYHFKRWKPKKDDLLKYFKNEAFGTKALFREEAQNYRPISSRKKSLTKVLQRPVKLLAKIDDGSIQVDAVQLKVIERFLTLNKSDPVFVGETLSAYIKRVYSLRDELKQTVVECNQLRERLIALEKEIDRLKDSKPDKTSRAGH